MNMVDLNQDGKNELVSVPNGELNIPYETQRYAAFVIEGAHGDGNVKVFLLGKAPTLPDL